MAKNIYLHNITTKLVLVMTVYILFLCSCSTGSATYENQEIIELNYNNITNDCRYWLTTDSVCYLTDVLVQPYIMADKNGKTVIGTNEGYGDGSIQRYDDKIYMMHTSAAVDEENSEYELKCYDVVSKKTEKLCSVKNCVSFLVLDESVYYLEYSWGNASRRPVLKRYSIRSKEHMIVQDGVVSMGVIDQDLYYLVGEDSRMAVMMYDASGNASVMRGEFLLDGFDAEKGYPTFQASYTSDCLFVSQIDYETKTSTLWTCSFAQNTVSSRILDGYLEEFVAHDAQSYLIISSDGSEELENSELYQLNNDTDEMVKMAEFRGMGSLFVGSDGGAYVLRHNDMQLVFYSNEGQSQVVYRF